MEESNVVSLTGDLNRGKKYESKRVPEYTSGAPRMPSHLSPEAKREWRRVVPELESAGTVALVDRSLLIGWCESTAALVAASRDLSARGLLVASAREGEPVKNPSAAIQRDALNTLRALGRMFGFEPGRRKPAPVDAARPGETESERMTRELRAKYAGQGK